MKVLHISTFDSGGAGKACLRLHKELLGLGVESKVLVRNSSDKAENVFEIWEGLNPIQKLKKWTQQEQVNKSQKKQLSFDSAPEELFSFYESIWDITQTSWYKEADIIHLHWVMGFVDFATFFPSSNKKIIWTLHDFAPFSNGFHYPVPEAQQGYSELEQKNKEVITQAYKNLQITVVAPSQYLRNASQNSAHFKNFKHALIPNSTSSEYAFLEQKEARESLNIPENEKVVLFVSQDIHYKRKGFSVLFEALEEVNTIDAKFYVVGNGKVPNHQLVKGVSEINSEQKMNQLYAASDVFVIPSLDDNYPNTVSEALCSGTPVVSFNVGGIPEMLTAENGIICPETSFQALALGIDKALDITWNRQVISANAVAKFNGKDCALAYKKLYK